MKKFSDIDLSQVGNEVLLVGGVWAGDGKAYFCYFPEFGPPPRGTEFHEFDMSYDDWKALLRQSDIMETEVLAKAEDGSLYKAVARKSQRNIDQGVSWRVYKRDEYRCRYCGNDDVPLTVDHLVLWEEGGPSIEQNLVAACRKCNKRRGNMQYEDWLDSDYYQRVSANLDEAIRGFNRAIAMELPNIPRQIRKRSKR